VTILSQRQENESAPESDSGADGVSEHVSKPESGGGRSRGDSNNDCANDDMRCKSSVCPPDSRKSRHRGVAFCSGDFD
jgi:hypothetical protein